MDSISPQSDQIGDYELLDSGQNTDSKGQKYGEKLERFGSVMLRRPDPEVLWQKHLSDEEWARADATFIASGLSKKWQRNTEKYIDQGSLPEQWIAEVGGLKFNLTLGGFKHVGIFPEQVSQWQWMGEKITATIERNIATGITSKPKVLNLFGYTGGATCALAKAGAEVTHVDALESNCARTKENLALNNLADAPVRLIADDVRKFIDREIRRGAKYDAIIMDPPVYGKGDKKRSKKSEWQLEDDFLPLLEQIKKLLSDKPIFWVISGYASEYSALSYANALSDVLADTVAVTFADTKVTHGELSIPETNLEKGKRRFLPAGIFARAEF